MQVRAKVTHTQAGTGTFRREGEEFEHAGKLYKHVEVVKSAEVVKADEKKSDKAEQ